jgi:hypothetical protein
MRVPRGGRPLVITKSALAIVQLLDCLDLARSHHLGPVDRGAVHVRQDCGDRLSAGTEASVMSSPHPSATSPWVLRPAGPHPGVLRAVHMAMIGQPGFAVVAGNWRADEHSV